MKELNNQDGDKMSQVLETIIVCVLIIALLAFIYLIIKMRGINYE